ncbi:MAG: hypothetical protein GWM98_24545 [Nitrospinaceae bacterium]|nr:hypothetical protein [Nitrospinaceae bacterium]
MNALYFNQGYSKRTIARLEGVSTDFVVDWTQSKDQDCTADARGWEKGRHRKWDEMVEDRIKTIRLELEAAPDQYYIGPTAIQVEYHRRYPEEDLPPVRTIGQMLSDLGLSLPNKSRRTTGAAQYLCYPEWTIYTGLGGRVMESDFVGEKFITGRSAPIHFIGFSCKKPPRFRHYARVEGETTDVFIRETRAVFTRFETPNFLKIDNAMAMIGGRRGKRAVSRAMIFLLGQGVIPIFSVPRKPFSQASIEGNNSVFGRKFWNRWEFGSVENIDARLAEFNAATRRYCQYAPPDPTSHTTDPFVPRVYFTRQVQQAEPGAGGTVHILGETIALPTDYVKYFVLGEWNLREESLKIRFEKEKESTVLKEVKFPINERSKEKWGDVLND